MPRKRKSLNWDSRNKERKAILDAGKKILKEGIFKDD